MKPIGQIGALTACLLAFATATLAQATLIKDYSDRAEIGAMRALFSSITARRLASDAEFRSEANLIGFRSKSALLSRRLDSRTYFFQALRHEQETTKGHDQILRKQAIETRLTLLRRLSVPATEIRKPKLVQERSQTGYRESGAVELTLGKEQLGPSWVSVSRQIEGIPVFSSRALIQLRDRQ